MSKKKLIQPLRINQKRNIQRILRIFSLSFAIMYILGIGVLINLVQFSFETDLDFQKLQYEAGIESVSIYDSTGNLTYHDALIRNVNIEDIPKYTKNAFIAIEDKRFYEHNGIDLMRIGGAIVQNIKDGKYSEGASTITQQLIKNTMLDSEKTFKRKFTEAALAQKLEQSWTKDQILEAYLNKIYFGNNLYGISAASKFYFNKKVSNLTLKESAILASIINAPSLYEPTKNFDNCMKRTQIVLNTMKDQKMISDEEYTLAINEPINITQTRSFDIADNSYEMQAIKEAQNILECDTQTLLKGNFKIKTYQDRNLQDTLTDMINNENYYSNNSNDMTYDGMSIIADNEQKSIVAYGCKSDKDLTNIQRQPGSIIKPIICYAPAIESGILTHDSLILDEKINIDGYSPSNYNDKYYGWVTADFAMQKSLNSPAIKLMEYVGIDNCKNFASKLGITFNQNDQGYALALGGFTDGVSLMQLSTAYSSFATNGNYNELKFISEIYDKNDKLIYKRKLINISVMSENTATEITSMLKDTAKTGTAKRLYGLDLASKTGTVASTLDSSKNTDAYNISYNDKYLIAVWFGNTNGENGLLESNVNGGTYPTIFVQNVIKNMQK